MANINLKLLQTFMLVAELRSFRKAAEASNRTTSAVSMQIKQLEEQAEVVLLQRTSRSVELTLEGRYLQGKARQALTDLEGGLKKLKDAARLRRGIVRLASSPSIASTLLPKVLATFGRSHPEVTVRVRELGSQEILEAVREQTVDFGIGPKVARAADFNFATLLMDELCVLTPMHHPLARRTPIGLTQLQDSPCVMLSSFSAMRIAVDEAAAEAGVALNIQFEVQQTLTLMAMVSAGLGIGIAPRISLGLAQNMPVKVLELMQPRIQREMSLITLRGCQPSPLALELSSLLHASVLD